MPKNKTLHDAFIEELRDAYDAEKQLTKALPKLAKKAASEELKSAFESHLKETENQVTRLEEVFESIGAKASGKHCDGMAGIIEENKAMMEEDFDESTLDACLVAGAQRVEHYEIAAYGNLIAWAKAMGHDAAVELLNQTLEEEKAADDKLTSIGEDGLNAQAAELAHADAAGEEDAPSRKPVSSQKKQTGKARVASRS